MEGLTGGGVKASILHGLVAKPHHYASYKSEHNSLDYRVLEYRQ